MDTLTSDEDDDDVATRRPPAPDQVIFSVGDDILPRYFTQSAETSAAEEADGAVVPYELYPAATKHWAGQVRRARQYVVHVSMHPPPIAESVCGGPVRPSVRACVGILAGPFGRASGDTLRPACSPLLFFFLFELTCEKSRNN